MVCRVRERTGVLPHPGHNHMWQPLRQKDSAMRPRSLSAEPKRLIHEALNLNDEAKGLNFETPESDR